MHKDDGKGLSLKALGHGSRTGLTIIVDHHDLAQHVGDALLRHQRGERMGQPLRPSQRGDNDGDPAHHTASAYRAARYTRRAKDRLETGSPSCRKMPPSL